jgi:hypothetical protein
MRLERYNAYGFDCSAVIDLLRRLNVSAPCQVHRRSRQWTKACYPACDSGFFFAYAVQTDNIAKIKKISNHKLQSKRFFLPEVNDPGFHATFSLKKTQATDGGLRSTSLLSYSAACTPWRS